MVQIDDSLQQINTIELTPGANGIDGLNGLGIVYQKEAPIWDTLKAFETESYEASISCDGPTDIMLSAGYKLDPLYVWHPFLIEKNIVTASYPTSVNSWRWEFQDFMGIDVEMFEYSSLYAVCAEL